MGNVKGFFTALRWQAGLSLGLLTLSSALLGDDNFHEFSEPHLKSGREIWLGTCVNCHATGFASAPSVTSITAWRPRLEKPIEVLYQHALEGFYGEDYAHMPPRGGNDSLSDEQVKRAVDYMTELVKFMHEER
ncbi:MAG: c-type cytochrome [Pseudomonadota bacterium]